MKKFCSKDYFDSDLLIFLDKTSSRTNDCLPHTHDFIEMVYICDGKGIHNIDDESYEVGKGTVLVIDSGRVHSFVCQGKMSLVNIVISTEFIGSGLNSTFADLIEQFGFERGLSGAFYQLSAEDIIAAERICDSMIEEVKNRDFGYKGILSSYLQVLISLMLRGSKKKDIKRQLPCEIIEFIDAHLYESITIEEIAKNSYYNPAYLSRVFKESYGMSIKDYISEKRISRAISLLLETSLSVSEIALQVGYTNKNQFYKNFESIVGKSPSDVRKNLK